MQTRACSSHGIRHTQVTTVWLSETLKQIFRHNCLRRYRCHQGKYMKKEFNRTVLRYIWFFSLAQGDGWFLPAATKARKRQPLALYAAQKSKASDLSPANPGQAPSPPWRGSCSRASL